MILDSLIAKIAEGELEVNENLLLMYGNLKAMSVNRGRGERCIESELGSISNLNRCFGSGEFKNPASYAQMRANQVMNATQRLVAGAVEGVDIHQSFSVPTVGEVRGIKNRNEYTYAMLYPFEGVERTCEWVNQRFSDIVAGGVLNPMEGVQHSTFAGYLAQNYEADVATFEQGSIGWTDWNTFTPQLGQNLADKISGQGDLKSPLDYDLWEVTGAMTRETENFEFLDANGDPIQNPPGDFLPIAHRLIARDGNINHTIEEDERLLFANADVPIGDRAAAVIKKA